VTPPIAVDWDALKSEWPQRTTNKIRDELFGLNLIPDRSFDSIDCTLKDERYWLQAFETNGGTALLAYFVFAWGMSTWEYTSNHQDVRKNIADARSGYLRARRHADGVVNEDGSANTAQRDRLWRYFRDEQQLVHLIFECLTIPVDLSLTTTEDEPPPENSGTLLLDAMNVESAVYSGSLVATRKRAARVIDICDRQVLASELSKTGGALAEVRGLLRDVVGAHREYYGCIEKAADVLERAASSDPEVVPALEDAIEHLATTQKELGDDVYASELPAYRVALKAWRDRLMQAAPPVQLNRMEITYVYPFALSGIDGKEAQEFALKDKDRPLLGGLSSSQPDELQLTDVWTWGGRRRKLNSTVLLEMPDLTVQIQDDGVVCNYDVQLRFNDLGNHYLRVHRELENPELNDIHQALRRATTYSGEQNVKSGGSDWMTIAAYAEHVITDVTNWITAKYKADSSTRTTELEQNYAFKPDFDYHVVVVIDEASVTRWDGSRREATKEEIVRDHGPLLLQTLNRECTTLDEWICWTTPQAVPNLLGEACFPGDFAIGTRTTTILCMPSTPRWARCGYEEVAEFAASFPPLIYQTRTALDDKLKEAEQAGQRDDNSDLDRQEAELNKMRSDLHDSLENIRKIHLYLVPYELLSLHAEGVFLDHLYRRSRLPELRADLDSYLERGRTAIDRMNTREARLHDHRDRKYQNTVQLILFFVGTFSFSGVAALFLTALYGSNIPGSDTAGASGNGLWSLGNATLVVVVYVVVVVFGYRRIVQRSQPRIVTRRRCRHG
jgi:hypothetical protein